MTAKLRRWADRTSVLIIIGTLLLLGIGSARFVWQLEREYRAAIGHARDLALGQARSLREEVDQSLAGIDIALGSLNVRPDLPGISTDSDPERIYQRLRALRLAVPALISIGIVNAGGNLIAVSETPNPTSADLSARDYFRRHRDDPATGLVVDPPTQIIPDNIWAIPVTRRLVDGKGGFAGVVGAMVRPEYFREIYRSVDADVVLLSRADGTPLVRYRRNEPVAITAMPVAGVTAQQIGPDREGNFDAVSRADGVERIYGYARSNRYPVFVIVALNRDEALAAWRSQRNLLGATAMVMVGLLLAFSTMLLRWVKVQRDMTNALSAARDTSLQARIAAEAANRAKSEFLAHMTHELRTPLNAINGYAEFIAQEPYGALGDARYREYVETIKSSGDHLLAIINNILDMAKVDAGKWQVHLEQVDLDGLFHDLGTMTRGRARSFGVNLDIETPQGTSTLFSDRRLLLQILLNLTTNAIKFTPKDGQVTVNVRPVDQGLEFTVTDTGEGMTAQDISRVLEPFGQGSSELARQRHDTGLGLTLSQRFVSLLGGSLTIHSDKGTGTRVTIRFPVGRAA